MCIDTYKQWEQVMSILDAYSKAVRSGASEPERIFFPHSTDDASLLLARAKAHYALSLEINPHLHVNFEQENSEKKRQRRKRKEWDEMEQERKAHEWQVRLNKQNEERRGEAETEKGIFDVPEAFKTPIGWRELIEIGECKKDALGRDERQEGELER